MNKRQAACSCGKLTVSVEGEPVRLSVCHCLECQKRTGSPFGMQARYPLAHTSITGSASEYRRVADSGNTVTFHFCPSCGSTVYWQIDKVPDMLIVGVGGFADPAFPPPRISVYEERKHAWVGLPEGIQREG